MMRWVEARRRTGWKAVAVGVAVLLASSAARADHIVLRGGGSLNGAVVPDPDQPGKVLVLTETSAKPIVFNPDQILRVIEQEDAFDAYFARRDQTEPTAQAQYELGRWCEENRLTGLAAVHYQKAVEQDEGHAEAHKKLGNVEYQGRWMSYDAMREAQGLVRYKGRWVLREQKDRIDHRATASAESVSWARRLVILRGKLTEGNNEERAEAERQLDEIDDPAAVPALVQVFGGGDDAMRVRLARLLEAIPGDEARRALMGRVLAEGTLAVREVALDALKRRTEVETVPELTRLLRSADPVVVGRSAWALAGLEAVSAVPKLIPVLVQAERAQVMVPTTVPATPSGGMGMSVGFGSFGVGPGPASASFGVSGGGGVAGGSLATGGGLAGGGPSGFAEVQSFGVVTGPVVGPGVVDYGAASVPLASGPFLGMGGGVVSTPAVPTMVPRTVTRPRRNPDVLAALMTLTGKDFGYDQVAWRRWLGRAVLPRGTPERRVPQP